MSKRPSTCRVLHQQGRLYQRRSGCVKPLQKKSCWRLGTPSPTAPATQSPINHQHGWRLASLCGPRLSRVANPHASWPPSFRGVSSHSFARAFSPSNCLSGSISTRLETELLPYLRLRFQSFTQSPCVLTFKCRPLKP